MCCCFNCHNLVLEFNLGGCLHRNMCCCFNCHNCHNLYWNLTLEPFNTATKYYFCCWCLCLSVPLFNSTLQCLAVLKDHVIHPSHDHRIDEPCYHTCIYILVKKFNHIHQSEMLVRLKTAGGGYL